MIDFVHISSSFDLWKIFIIVDFFDISLELVFRQATCVVGIIIGFFFDFDIVAAVERFSDQHSELFQGVMEDFESPGDFLDFFLFDLDVAFSLSNFSSESIDFIELVLEGMNLISEVFDLFNKRLNVVSFSF